MADAKTYLNIPFAQKDEAKALGARWDSVQKKWFAPADKDITLFAKWQTEPGTVSSAKSTTSKPSSTPKRASAAGVKTHAQDKDFVAYSGNLPPWN